MNRLSIALTVLIVGILMICGCTPSIKEDIRDVRTLHREYRAATVPRDDLPAEAVDRLGQQIDLILKNLEEISE